MLEERCRFSDDIFVILSSIAVIAKATAQLELILGRKGLKLSPPKLKFIICGSAPTVIQYRGADFTTTSETPVLGTFVSFKGNGGANPDV